jgi:hypothetical protein
MWMYFVPVDVLLDKPTADLDAIVAGKPELFIFLGDNIYGDSPRHGGAAGQVSPAARATRIRAIERDVSVCRNMGRPSIYGRG